jgi:hypothetical protein
MQHLFFDELEPGRFELHAPVIDDVIQVTGHRFPDSTLLAIDAEPPQITIARDDGHGLMVQVGEAAYRRQAFTQPVSRLVLKQDPATESWEIQPAEDLVIASESAAIEFLQILGAFGMTKRNRLLNQGNTLALRAKLAKDL